MVRSFCRKCRFEWVFPWFASSWSMDLVCESLEFWLQYQVLCCVAWNHQSRPDAQTQSLGNDSIFSIRNHARCVTDVKYCMVGFPVRPFQWSSSVDYLAMVGHWWTYHRVGLPFLDDLPFRKIEKRERKKKLYKKSMNKSAENCCRINILAIMTLQVVFIWLLWEKKHGFLLFFFSIQLLIYWYFC